MCYTKPCQQSKGQLGNIRFIKHPSPVLDCRMLPSPKELTSVPAGPGPDSDTVPDALWLKAIHFHPFELKRCMTGSVQRMCVHTRVNDWTHIALELCTLCEPKVSESRTPSKKRKFEAGPGFSIIICKRGSRWFYSSPQSPELYLRGFQSSTLTSAGAKPICSVMDNLSASAMGIKARC